MLSSDTEKDGKYVAVLNPRVTIPAEAKDTKESFPVIMFLCCIRFLFSWIEHPHLAFK